MERVINYQISQTFNYFLLSLLKEFRMNWGLFKIHSRQERLVRLRLETHLFDDNCHKFAKMLDCEQKALCPELIEPVQYYIGLF